MGARPQNAKPVTRDEIVRAARSALGVKFLHQGRDIDNGLDCVGLCVHVAKSCGVEHVHDLDAYKRVPSASTLREYMEKNLAEIPVAEAKRGDFLLMKLGGAKPRHVAIVSEDATDYAEGVEPKMIHALSTMAINRVVEQPIAHYRGGIVAAYRVEGVTD